MTWLLEDPLPVLGVGLAVSAVALVVYVQSRHSAALGVLAAVVLLTAGLVLVERLVVTDAERIETVLLAAADAVERNDLDALFAQIAPGAEGLKTQARIALGRIEMREARITGDLEILVNELTSPVSARATFIGRARGDLRRGGNVYDSIVRRFDVKLTREPDGWRILEVAHRDFR